MTEIEKKALALMNEVREEEGLPPLNETYFDTIDRVALCRAIEQHEALEAEVERVAGPARLWQPWKKLDAAAPAEPVAFLYTDEEGGRVACVEQIEPPFEGWTETSLYAHPPAAPTNALVEKVARALAKSNGDDPDMRLAPGDEYERAWQLYADDARAALAAMQEAKP